MKKLLTIVLAILLLFSSVACQKSDTAENTDDVRSDEGSTTQSTTSDELVDDIPINDAPSVDTDRNPATFKRISKITYTTNHHPSEGVDGWMSDWQFEYDDNGKIHAVEYDHGVIVSMATFDGSILKPLYVIGYNSRGQETTRVTYEYDENDQLVKETTEKKDKPAKYVSYQYNQNGDLTKEVHYSGEEKQRDITYENRYDDYNRLIEQLSHTERYEDYLNGIPERTFTSELRQTYEYNENGAVIRHTIQEDYIDVTRVSEYIWNYDSDGRLAEKIEYDNGEEYARTTYRYDSDGNITEASETGLRFDGIAEEQNTTYEYDSEGYFSQYTITLNNNTTVCTVEYDIVSPEASNTAELKQYLEYVKVIPTST